MPAIVNLADFAKIAVISFAFIWVVNRGLVKAGFPQYKA